MWVVALYLRVEFHYEYFFVNCYYRKYTFMNFCTKKTPKLINGGCRSGQKRKEEVNLEGILEVV